MKQTSKFILPAMFFGLFLFLTACNNLPEEQVEQDEQAYKINGKYIGQYSCTYTWNSWYMGQPDSSGSGATIVTVTWGNTWDKIIVLGHELAIDSNGYGETLYAPPNYFMVSFSNNGNNIVINQSSGGLGGYTSYSYSGLKI